MLDYLTQKSIGLIQRETVSRKRTRKIKSVVAEITFGDVAPLRILVVKVRVTVMDILMEVKMMAIKDAKEALYVGCKRYWFHKSDDCCEKPSEAFQRLIRGGVIIKKRENLGQSPK